MQHQDDDRKISIELDPKDAERLESFIGWLCYADIDRVTGHYPTQPFLDMLLQVQIALGEALLPQRDRLEAEQRDEPQLP